MIRSVRRCMDDVGKNKARNGDKECLLGIMGKRVRDIQRESDIC